MSRSRLLALVSLVLAVLAGTAAVALAVTRHGVTPVAPKAGDTVPVGKVPTFKLRVRGKGQVYVHVCKTREKNAQGVICARESVGRARRVKGRAFRYRPRFHNFPGFWLNREGTYYWQAHRIRCVGRRTKDCRQEGPVLKVQVG